MKKKDIIKKEIAGYFRVYGGEDIEIVDLEKLAEFLAKYLKIKLEDLIEKDDN